MRKLKQWFESQGGWSSSEFSGLPRLDPADGAELQRWRVVAGGLALILSRLRPVEIQQRFASTHALYNGVRRRLRQGTLPDAPAALLNEVMHEVADMADPQTKACLRSCFQARLTAAAATADHQRALAPAN